MNAQTSREIRRFARASGWTRRQYRRAKRTFQRIPRPERGAVLEETRRHAAAIR